MKNILMTACIIMMIWFILPVFTGGVLNIGNIAGILFFLILWLLLKNSSHVVHWPLWLRTAGIVLIVTVFITAGFSAVQMVIASNIEPEGNETMIILGGGLNGSRPSRMLVCRLRTAKEYLQSHPDMPVIVSGGQGNNENITEADAMETWLRNNGVANRIYKEEQSTNTDQNIRFSKEIIQNEHLSMSAAVVTDGFHEYRSRMLCAKYNLSFHAVPVHTYWWLLPTFFTREVMAVVKTWLTR